MEKSWKKSWNVMEFGFENYVGTLVPLLQQKSSQSPFSVP